MHLAGAQDFQEAMIYSPEELEMPLIFAARQARTCR
jgi:hypothetical protein